MRISWLTILFFCLLAAMMSPASSLNTPYPVQFRNGLQDGPTTHFRVNALPEDGTFLQIALFCDDTEDNEYEQSRKKNNCWQWSGTSESIVHPLAFLFLNRIPVYGYLSDRLPAGEAAYLRFRNLRF